MGCSSSSAAGAGVDCCVDPMNMAKGEFITVPSRASKFSVGFGWKTGCDVDASVICLEPKGKLADRVYYRNKEAFGGAVKHSGDNRTGQGDGDDETVEFDLHLIPKDVTHIFLTVNVYNEDKSLEDVKDEYVTAYDTEKKPIIKIQHLAEYGKVNGVVLAAIYREGPGEKLWRVQAVGHGAPGRTSRDLIDDCQTLQGRVQGQADIALSNHNDKQKKSGGGGAGGSGAAAGGSGGAAAGGEKNGQQEGTTQEAEQDNSRAAPAAENNDTAAAEGENNNGEAPAAREADAQPEEAPAADNAAPANDNDNQQQQQQQEEMSPREGEGEAAPEPAAEAAAPAAANDDDDEAPQNKDLSGATLPEPTAASDPLVVKKNEFLALPDVFSAGFGWTGAGCDVDASVICIDKDGELSERVYFKKKQVYAGAIKHLGDNRSGKSSGDDETIEFDLDRVPENVTHLFLTINVYNKDKSLADVSGEYARILVEVDGEMQELARLPHTEDYGTVNGVVAAAIYRPPEDNKPWVIRAVGLGAPGRTSKFLIDECQELQKCLGSCPGLEDAPPAAAREVVGVPEIESTAAGESMDVKKHEFVTLPSPTVTAGFGWKSNGCDVDASVICIDKDGELSERVYFKKKQVYDGGIKHLGDNRTGQGEGDDETIEFDLSKIPENVAHLFLTINVYNKDKSLADVDEEYVHVTNAGDGQELLKIKRLDNYGSNGGVVVSCFVRVEGDEWKMQAVGFPAAGRTSKALIDECQMLAKKIK